MAEAGLGHAVHRQVRLALPVNDDAMATLLTLPSDEFPCQGTGGASGTQNEGPTLTLSVKNTLR